MVGKSIAGKNSWIGAYGEYGGGSIASTEVLFEDIETSVIMLETELSVDSDAVESLGLVACSGLNGVSTGSNGDLGPFGSQTSFIIGRFDVSTIRSSRSQRPRTP